MNENIVHINYEDKDIYLVKTAHVSKNSIEDVVECFNEVHPDTICIELDKQRYSSLENNDRWRDTDIIEIIKKKQVGYLLVNMVLSSFQRRMAKSMGSMTGGEMIKGIELAKENNLELVLADRDIKTTFSRIWSLLPFGEKAKLISSIIASVFDDEDISEEDLQKLKEADALEAALSEVGEEFPIVKKVLVDERDMYLSQKIKNAKGKTILAIIGAAHAGGIQRNINNTVDLKELEVIKKDDSKGIAKWIIPLIIITLIVLAFFINREKGIASIKSWILWNGCLSALGCIICLAHPLTVLTAFVAAPITSLNPLLAAGFFAGIVEASIRKPKVKDFEDIAEDTSTIKGFFKNRVTRILLIVLFASLFSSVATFVSGIDIFANLF